MEMLTGWLNVPAEVEKHSSFTKLLSTPRLEEKEVLLYEAYRRALNRDPIKGPQGIGDCVSWATASFVNHLSAIEILNGEAEEFQEAATEVIYALSRVEIGGQRGSFSDGSTGIWAMKALQTKGTLSRKYLQERIGKGDYDKNRAKQWGASGLPDELEPDALKHLVKTVSFVKSFEQAASAIQNGYPVVVCSDQGFSMTRDSRGFAAPRGTWYHAMLFNAVRFDRPGLCCMQSWGANVPDGPLDKGQPDNSFWVDAKVADRMLAQGDSFTGSQFDGYPAQDVISWRH